jgi:hypothetical protein
VLFSEALVAKAAVYIELDCLGKFNLRGLSCPMDVYAFAENGGDDDAGHEAQFDAAFVRSPERSRPMLPAAG